jgi:hypothetical protein
MLLQSRQPGRSRDHPAGSGSLADKSGSVVRLVYSTWRRRVALHCCAASRLSALFGGLAKRPPRWGQWRPSHSALLRWTANDLAREAALGRSTILRAEVADDQTSLTAANDLALRRALEAAGVEFIDEDGGGPGVRLRKRHGKRPSRVPDSGAQ